MKWLLFTLLVLWGKEASAKCNPDALLMYRMVLHTEWSEDNFPKQYPTHRPPAQWSVVVGRTHNSSGFLWRLGNPASDPIKLFVETGEVNKLIREDTSTKQGILSEFFAPPVAQGVGKTETKFFVDPTYSKVSIICRITPSPDWFIGVDSFDLCHGNKWVDSITLDLQPIDGGTDDGYTFTAPNFATDPRSNITLIESRFPNHPANSFFYPELEKLPRIAFVRFLKIKEFFLTKEIFRDLKGSSLKIKSSASVISSGHNIKITEPSLTYSLITDIQEELTTTSPVGELGKFPTEAKQSKNRKRKNILQTEVSEFNSKSTAFRSKPRKAHKRNRPKACKVSEWSNWEPCNNGCGFGEQKRRRKPTQYASTGGRPCPQLIETKWCRSTEKCQNHTISLFRWQ